MTNTKVPRILLILLILICTIGMYLFYSNYMKPAHEFCNKSNLGDAKDWEILSASTAGIECDTGGIMWTGWTKGCNSYNKWGTCNGRGIYLKNNKVGANQWK